MTKRSKGNTLEKWEVALVKALLAKGGRNDQDVLAYFTRPTRSINHRLIGQIRTGDAHKAIKAATDNELDQFLANWPEIEPSTGLAIKGDELLIKSREAMIAAVQTFNGAGLYFRSELFIVTAIIAWTYLMHSWFKNKGIDYRHRNKTGEIVKTKEGADKFWELQQCLKHAKCPLDKAVITNLEFLLSLRHEIEHRSTDRIDDAVSAKLQACCINYNMTVASLFGPQFGIERRLPIALQFVTFDIEQRAALKKASALPANIQTMMDSFHGRLSDEEQGDPRFAYRVAFIPKHGNRATTSDLAIEFISDTDEGSERAKVLLKEVDKKRYIPSEIVKIMRAEGFQKFNLTRHTELWKALQAKDPAKGFCKRGLYKDNWEWFEPWLARVRAHCQENAGRYQ